MRPLGQMEVGQAARGDTGWRGAGKAEESGGSLELSLPLSQAVK